MEWSGRLPWGTGFGNPMHHMRPNVPLGCGHFMRVDVLRWQVVLSLVWGNEPGLVTFFARLRGAGACYGDSSLRERLVWPASSGNVAGKFKFCRTKWAWPVIISLGYRQRLLFRRQLPFRVGQMPALNQDRGGLRA